MLSDTRKNILRVILTLFILHNIITSIVNTWSWRQDHFDMFDLASEMQKNNTNFYAWLGVEPTATISEISKAHRQLVVKYHPSTSSDSDAQRKFDIVNKIAQTLRSNELRSVYDSILQNNRLPYFKGVISICVMEYLKAWDNYLTDKVAFEHFIRNAKSMAQKISDKHTKSKSHKSFIDLGDKTIECGITPDKEIFLFNEKGQKVPLSSSTLLSPPSLFNLTFIRLPYDFIHKKMKSK